MKLNVINMFLTYLTTNVLIYRMKWNIIKIIRGYWKNKYKEIYVMKISYKKLWIMLVERDISQAKFRKDLNIASGTMTKLRRNEEVALSILLRICEYLDCNIGDVGDVVRTDEVLHNTYLADKEE